MKIHGFLIAAPQSGSGKTTVSMAIMAAFVRRGMSVAPFKCGPDFIDPGYHRAVTGNASINLDAWICSEEFVSRTFLTSRTSPTIPTSQAIAVIEGVMGLFDGIGASYREGSSARIAAITGAPVVIVVNARGMAASAAALVNGFAGFDPEVRVAGVIFNNVGSEKHATLLKEVINRHCPGITCFGCIPRNENLVIPSRHLGLVTADDNPLSASFISRLADMAESCLDLDGLSQLQIPPAPPLEKWGEISTPLTDDGCKVAPPFSKGGLGGISVPIAVARDAAFCFIYEDNLRLLLEAGGEIVYFSPLKDAELPSGIGGIYLPGGYPELYAGELAANRGMLEGIMIAVAKDMPVYAECGGFVYLTEGLEASETEPEADFAGVFPGRARMLPKRKALGYRQVELTGATIIGTEGITARGHEFHYSEIGAMPDSIERSYRVSKQGEELGAEGYHIRNCLGSYIHLHFGSNQGIAPAFVDACRCYSSKLS